MYYGFDHLIMAVSDMEQAVAEATAKGFTIVERPDRETGSLVSRFSLLPDGSYLLLLQFLDPANIAGHRLAPALAAGDGWVDYSLWTDSVAACATQLSAVGAPMRGPLTYGATLTTGESWEVILLLAGYGAGHPLLPFLAEDATTRALRVPPMGETVQPFGATGTAGITLVTADIAPAFPALTALFGAPTASPRAIAGAKTVHRFTVGPRWIDIAEATPRTGLAGEHLARRGDGLFEVVLAGNPDTPAFSLCGARLAFA